ncbi:MAG: ATP-binding protein [bacterium]
MQPNRGADGGQTPEPMMPGEATAVREVEDRLASLNLLVGTISHAIRGQLTGLDGGIYLVKSGAARSDTERMTRGLAMVERNADRIRSTVLNILYYAKDREPVREPVFAPDLVEELAEPVRKRCDEAGIALSTEIASGAGELRADPKAVRSLVLNMLESALEACAADSGEGRHRIRLSVFPEAEQIVFQVRDSGRGLDPETVKKVSSPLFASKIEGAALGLFISNKIAAAHGGSFRVDPGAGDGNTVTARLPKG